MITVISGQTDDYELFHTLFVDSDLNNIKAALIDGTLPDYCSWFAIEIWQNGQCIDAPFEFGNNTRDKAIDFINKVYGVKLCKM